MTTLTMRPYRGEADLDAIAHLINTCDAVDQLDQGTSITELQQEFNTPSLDQARDLKLWEDTEGKLIGFGQLWIPPLGEVSNNFFRFFAHPRVRGSDLEKQIVAWGEGRMREVKQEHGVQQLNLQSSTRADQSQRIALLERCGFTPERYFFTMERSLSLPISEPQLPEGFTIRQIEGEKDTQAWVEMYNQTFIDHWGHYDFTVELANHYLRDPHYKPELDLIAVAPDGTFAGFCYCHINPEDNQRNQRNEGWITGLGTRRGFRKLGIGRAMLLTGIQRLKAAGVDRAKLGVDSQNPSSAGRLYESVGFHQVHTHIWFIKDVL